MEYRVPESATVVAKTAMRSDVRRVVVPASVVEIADDAFRDWTNLAEVVFAPNSRLERIGTHAFTGTALKSFVAPDALREIGEGAFACCRSLREVRLNEGLRSVGETGVGAFQDSGLRTAHVPSLLRKLRRETFAGCKGLKKIQIAEGCEVRLEHCLADGTTLPDAVPESPRFDSTPRTQPDERDNQIQELKEQLLKLTNEKAELEGRERFYRQQCEQLQAELAQRQWQAAFALTIPACPEYTPEAQTDASPKEQKTQQTKTTKEQMLGDSRALVVPDGTDVLGDNLYQGKDCERIFVPKSVVKIQNFAFDGFKDLREVVFEEGSRLRTIGKYAFRNCSGLAEIAFPEGLERIGMYAFQGAGLQRLEFPGSLRVLSQGAFHGCKGLRSAVFREGLETLGTDEYPEGGMYWHGVFAESGLESVALPSTLRVIEYSAFQACMRLKSVSLPAGVTRLGKQCFYLSALASISLSPALRVIEKNAFRECKGLRSIRLPEGLEEIGLQTFFGCGLEGVELPGSLRIIAQGAFTKCCCLRTVKFNAGLEVLGTDEYLANGGTHYGVFQESGVERVELPSTLRRIEYNSFKNCDDLQSIALPDSVEYIGKMCFLGSGLLRVRLPRRGVKAEANAFDGSSAKNGVVFRDGVVFQKDQ